MDSATTLDAVTTGNGRLSGIARQGHIAFLGIPYATAKRFAPPEPAPAWSGVKEATKIGFAAPQTSHVISGFAASGPQDEDCLNLNVFTPACDGSKRPVMFWIHGGGFTHGAGYEPLYDGGPLAVRGDVVVVTINYRLGALGFLRLPEIGAHGNQALLDQVMALALGARQHRCVRRRSGAGDDLRRERRLRLGGLPRDDAAGARPVPPRHPAERRRPCGQPRCCRSHR